MISNNADAYGLTRARNHAIEHRVLDHRGFDGREAFDQALIEAIEPFSPDFIVLAGFMRVLGTGFVTHYAGKILNIHPSILPAYKGLDTHRRALENGEREHGVSIHLVNESLDDGPVLLRGRYPVEDGDSVEDLQRRGHALEHRMYPRLLQWLAEKALVIGHGGIVFNGEALKSPIEFDVEQIA